MTAAPHLWASYQALDRALVAKGYHATPPWWMLQIERAYRHPTALRSVYRVGRGGNKSTIAVRRAINETIYGRWKVAPGERHYYTFVSESKGEATQRLTLIRSILSALGIAYSAHGDDIDLDGRPLGFKVLACRVGAVSGWRAIGYTADEAAKWHNADSSANPAAEVIASLDSMTITHREARSNIVSSPMATLDYHAELFDQGDTGDQVTAWAPSWVANPDAISEADARKRARGSARVFEREFRAIPQAALAGAFDPDDVDAAFRDPPPVWIPRSRACFIDASMGRGDAFVAAMLGWIGPPPRDDEGPELVQIRTETADGRSHIRLEERSGLDDPDRRPMFVCYDHLSHTGKFAQRISADKVTAQIAALCKRHHCGWAMGDQYGAYWLAAGLAQHGIRYTSMPWSNPSKTEAVERLRHYLKERRVILPRTGEWRKELLTYNEKVTASGTITYNGPHDDHVATLITAMMADAEGWLPGAPYMRPPVYRDLTNLPYR